MKQGNLNIGLTYYQETQWIAAIKRYGISIMNKSLLSNDQKETLEREAKTEIAILDS